MPKKLYGQNTEKALKNFPISGWPMPAEFIRALAMIKEHAAFVNGELKEIPKSMSQAIAKAARSIKNGKHIDQFPVDVFQTGSGTSSNMNVNEVISEIVNCSLRARPHSLSTRSPSLRSGLARSKRAQVHPNDHVNRCQSSNDVVPTAMQISCALVARDNLIPSLEHLVSVIGKKAEQFHGIIKTGRTHYMDAVPVRLGDEFRSYATLLSESLERIDESIGRLCVLPLGGTAAGTGLNAHPQFAKKVIVRLRKETELPLTEAKDHVAAQSFPFASQAFSSALRETALVLHKIANDIRLMGMGPVAGLNELKLPALQAGSSIMPGKVNPVIPESVIQAAAHVIGADQTVSVWCVQGSTFELNTCMPLMAHSLLTSARLLSNASHVFADKCIKGIKANTKKIKHDLERNVMLVTPLAKEIGYEKAAEIAKETMRSGERIIDVASKMTSIPHAKLKRILDPQKMV